MRHFLKAAIGLFVVSALTASAAAATCVPVEPKEWSGHAQMIHSGPGLATSWFENNACDWAGFEQLNGTDGLVFDVEGQVGTGNITATLGATSLVNAAFQGYFLDAGCKKIEGSDFHVTGSLTSAPVADLLTIPVGAKWMEINSTLGGMSNDVTVTVRSDGIDCPKPPKKKKKK
jgi:hypothetical protein